MMRVSLSADDIKPEAETVPFTELQESDFMVPREIFAYADVVVFEDGSGFNRVLVDRRSTEHPETDPRDVTAIKPNPHDLRDLEIDNDGHTLGIEMPQPLHVIAAAVQLEDGLIISAPRPARHHHVMTSMIMQLGRKARTRDTGFLLSDGTYATRERAGAVALAAGQIKEHRHNKPFLYSEDIW